MRAEDIDLNTTIEELADAFRPPNSMEDHSIDPVVCRLYALMTSTDTIFSAPTYFGYEWRETDDGDEQLVLRMEWARTIAEGAHATVSIIFSFNSEGSLELLAPTWPNIYLRIHVGFLNDENASLAKVADEFSQGGISMELADFMAKIQSFHEDQVRRFFGWLSPTESCVPCSDSPLPVEAKAKTETASEGGAE
ncbi:hypothetical protein P8631_11620 [Guyparkeria sp. 1SP6A2]|nr:hypothetical protein [Guyparkeria sp. 1SP6A2]